MTPDGYDLEGVIGHGAQGDVLLARQRRVGGRRVAIKRVVAPAQQLAARLHREAQVLAALDHPNVVRLIDVVADDAGVSLVMTYAAGGSLAELLAARGRLSADDAVAVVVPVADALASAHARGVVHGDVKPANILLTGDGVPLLGDFGIARLTTDAVTAGTPEYADPSGRWDAAADVYALAVVAHQLLTGRRPDGEQPPPVRALAPDVCPGVAAAVDRALAQRPQRRFADAEAFATALREAVTVVAPRVALSGREPLAPATELSPPTRVFGPRPPVPAQPAAARRVPWAAVAAVAALLVSLPPAVVMLRPARAATPAVAPAPAPGLPVRAVAGPAPPAARWCRHAEPVPRPARLLTGDLDGSGCRSWVRRRGAVVEVALAGHDSPRRFRLGQPADQLLLGDWDCDGTDTVALYRPATGQVFHFSSWAQDEPASSAPATDSGVRGGRASVRTVGACDEVRVAGITTT